VAARFRTLRAPVIAGEAPSSFPVVPAPAAAVTRQGRSAVLERERWLADTLLAMTDTVAEEFDLRDHLDRVAARFSHLLHETPVGVAVTGEGPRDSWTVGGTDAPTRTLLGLEEATGAGPLTEAVRNGRQVTASTTGEGGGRWPELTSGFQALRVVAVHAFPLCHREQVLGAVVAYQGRAAPPFATALEAVQALAHGASIGVVQARTVARARRLASQLQGALDSRVAIEQAKGVLSERLAVPVEDAFSLMRRHARNHRIRLDSVAMEVVHGTMSATDLRVAS
jgi:hypothetical protein